MPQHEHTLFLFCDTSLEQRAIDSTFVFQLSFLLGECSDPIISMFISSVICPIHIFKDLHGVLPQVLWLRNFICYGCLTMPPLWGFFFDFFSGNCLLKLLNNASPFSGRHPVTNCFGANVLWLVKSLDFSRTGNSDSELRLHRNHREFFCPSGASQFHWLSPRGHYESVACIIVKTLSCAPSQNLLITNKENMRMRHDFRKGRQFQVSIQ